MLGRLLIALVSVLPRHGMSRGAGWLASRTIPRRRRATVLGGFSRVVGADPREAALPLEEYPTLNAYFTRTLAPGLRPVAPGALVSPVDATVGAWGEVVSDTLVQAKGHDYSLAALLADRAYADLFEGGTYTTLYLSPSDYHRIHAPIDGRVTAATYVPGDLWPVNSAAVGNVADLFARNERIVVRMETEGGGHVAVVPVGATMVGMTRLAFDERLHTNARRREVQRYDYDEPHHLAAGDPLGHFEFGSTVVLVCSRAAGVVEPLTLGASVRMGERIGSPATSG